MVVGEHIYISYIFSMATAIGPQLPLMMRIWETDISSSFLLPLHRPNYGSNSYTLHCHPHHPASRSYPLAARTPPCFWLCNHPGESGLGKSTLINTLFETRLYGPKQLPGPGADRGKTVQIESISAGEWDASFFDCKRKPDSDVGNGDKRRVIVVEERKKERGWLKGII